MYGQSMIKIGGAAVLLVWGPNSAYAHHSFAMFDAKKNVTVSGTVRQVDYANPHVWVYLAVENNGKIENWGMEGGNLGGLYRMGWTQDSVKVSDKITMQVHPLKDGTTGGQIVRVTTADGHVFGRGGPPQ